jgi:hypothetical protein
LLGIETATEVLPFSVSKNIWSVSLIWIRWWEKLFHLFLLIYEILNIYFIWFAIWQQCKIDISHCCLVDGISETHNIINYMLKNLVSDSFFHVSAYF